MSARMTAAPSMMRSCAASYSSIGRPASSASTQRMRPHARVPTTTSDTTPNIAAMRAWMPLWRRARLWGLVVRLDFTAHHDTLRVRSGSRERASRTSRPPSRAKWQARWEAARTNSPDLDRAPRPFYKLMMFPYPSAEGLHVGNVFAFTGNDIYRAIPAAARGTTSSSRSASTRSASTRRTTRSRRACIRRELIPRNIANFTRQLRARGADGGLDARAVAPPIRATTSGRSGSSCSCFKRGLAYKKKAAVNWCPNDKTVLANEQVSTGCASAAARWWSSACWSSGSSGSRDYARAAARRISTTHGLVGDDDDGAAELDRPARGRGDLRSTTGSARRREAIARSVFTTRPDTIFGATYLVLAPEHPLLRDDHHRARSAPRSTRTARRPRSRIWSRARRNKEKTGVFTGAYAVNPATGDDDPGVDADYVLMEYGTGAIMAVPGHDERDFEFATEFELPIVRVVAGRGRRRAHAARRSVRGRRARGATRRSSTGSRAARPRRRITAWLAERGTRRSAVTNYRLHDWCISRQRYWGPPIPIIYCDECGMQCRCRRRTCRCCCRTSMISVPDDSGVSPLARHEEWYRVPCPECGKTARRETDVSRHLPRQRVVFPALSVHRVRRRAVRPRERMKRWLPVDSYIGGNEHAVLHLLYSRFITMVLHDAGYLAFEEPFKKFRAHGLIIRDGAKMSKTKGNVVNPDEYMDALGRGRVPHVPDVPGAVRRGRGLPRSGDLGRRAIPRPAVGVGAMARPAQARPTRR